MENPKKSEGSKKELEEILENIEEIDGRNGPEPTRYNDWENKGKCVDF